MRRRNLLIWAGFLVVLAACFSYPLFFASFAVTRDTPWLNATFFVVGAAMLALGIRRAFSAPDRYRGKIAGPTLGVLTLLLGGLFYYGLFVLTKLPAVHAAVKAGERAPAFALNDADGKQVRLEDLVQGRRGVLLIFYRGYW
jgi:hypothetical protein